ncbi:MAG: HD domain-containing protein, partial [Acidilobaceae archaeon]
MRPEFLGIYKPRAVIQDSIHGIIPINEAEYWILQTPFLRRLHEIKQLGLSYLVFPSATHSRLEHSLGVMHLASRMAYRVIEASRRSSKVCSALFEKCDDRVYSTFIQVARLAGLLHDLGHPPFSHMSEDTIEDLIFNPELRGLCDDSILGSLSEAKNAII